MTRPMKPSWPDVQSQPLLRGKQEEIENRFFYVKHI